MSTCRRPAPAGRTWTPSCGSIIGQSRRDNIHKARIKILVNGLGAEEFTRQVEAEWDKLDKAEVDLPDTELARIRQAFLPVAFAPQPAISSAFEEAKADPEFARFTRRNVHPHKVPGYAIMDISLKVPGQTPGDATSEQMEVVADLADAYSHGEVRVNYTQNLVLPHVKLADNPAHLRQAGGRGPGDRQHRPDHRHHRLPGAGLLHPGQRPRHSGGPGHSQEVRRP